MTQPVTSNWTVQPDISVFDIEYSDDEQNAQQQEYREFVTKLTQSFDGVYLGNHHHDDDELHEMVTKLLSLPQK